MSGAAVNEFDGLYESAWLAQTKLLGDGLGTHLIRWSTPVLAFGRWQTAKIATVGINPSPLEFAVGSAPLEELLPGERRFLHRTSASGSIPTAQELAKAKRLAEGYFELGHTYWKWFAKFDSFLSELGWTFAGGDACHTDCGSPYATAKGIGEVPPRIRRRLYQDGLPRWFSHLKLMPELKLILGMGSRCDLMPSLFGFHRWEEIPTCLDEKGGDARIQKPYLLHKVVIISDRCVDLFWWRPYWGTPLTWLDGPEKKWLAKTVREWASCL